MCATAERTYSHVRDVTGLGAKEEPTDRIGPYMGVAVWNHSNKKYKRPVLFFFTSSFCSWNWSTAPPSYFEIIGAPEHSESLLANWFPYLATQSTVCLRSRFPGLVKS